MLAVLGLVIGGIVGVVAVGFVEAVLALNDALLVAPVAAKPTSSMHRATTWARYPCTVSWNSQSREHRPTTSQ